MKPSRKKPKSDTAAPAAGVQHRPPKTSSIQPSPFRVPTWVLAAAGLLLCTLLAYSSAFQGGLIFDSRSRIVEDTRLHAATAANINLIFKSDYWHPSLGSGLYRPFTTLSFLFNYAVLGNGARPFGYHAINWLLHALNAILVYFLALRLVKRSGTAFAIAAIWSVHPVLTESVANVVGRADLLAGTGVLGGLLGYLESVESTGRRRWTWLGGAALATLIGAFSKESTVIVLALAALYEFLFVATADRRARIAGYIALALPCLIYWIVRSKVFAGAPAMRVPFTDNPIAGAGWFAAKLTAIKVIGMELWLLVWPARLSCDYSYNQIPIATAGDWKAWCALVACVALAAGGVVMYRKNRQVSFWIGFFFIALAPTSNLALIVGTPMAERFLYLPAIGFAGCVVAAAGILFRGSGTRLSQALLLVLAVALAGRTFARNLDWKNDSTLWNSAVAASPGSYKTHMTLAVVDPASAQREIDAAIAIVDAIPDEINPGMPYVEGGKIYRTAGDRLARAGTPQSRETYLKALALLERAERIRLAHQERNRRAGWAANLDLPPSWGSLDLELGRVYSRFSQFDHAIDKLRTALRYRIAGDVFEELSVAYFNKGDRDSAAIALFEGLVADPNNAKIAAGLKSIYELTPGGCALQGSGASATVNFECPMVHEQFCTASRNMSRLFRQTGHPDAADRTVRQAVESLHCAPGLFTGTQGKAGELSER